MRQAGVCRSSKRLGVEILMPSLSDVDLIFADLQDALTELEAARSSPKQVRRTFSRFVELTQRLTSAMRREAKSKTGTDWQASQFSGWNKITALFKDLRNEEQHERQIYISVHETRYYEIFGTEGGRVAFSGTWQLTDQLSERPPDGLRLFDSDPETGEMTKTELLHCDISYSYLIQPREDKLAARLRTIGSADLHELSRRCMITLHDHVA